MPTELGPVELTLGLRVDVAVPVGVDVNDSAEGGLEVAAEEPYDVNRGKILVSDSDPVGDVIGDKVLLPGPGELVVELAGFDEDAAAAPASLKRYSTHRLEKLSFSARSSSTGA